MLFVFEEQRRVGHGIRWISSVLATMILSSSSVPVHKGVSTSSIELVMMM